MFNFMSTFWIFGTLLLDFASHFFSYSLYFRPHYNLNLESIAVNGQSLPIDPSVFSTSNTRGTIVDSGTTLAYLAEEAYDPFVNAVGFLCELAEFLTYLHQDLFISYFSTR